MELPVVVVVVAAAVVVVVALAAAAVFLLPGLRPCPDTPHKAHRSPLKAVQMLS